MAKAKFVCTSKTGEETFSVVLEPFVHAMSEEDQEAHRAQVRADIRVAEAQGRHEDTKGVHIPGEGTRLHAEADRKFFRDVPHGSINLSVLTKESAAEFEVGRVTEVTFKLEK